MALITIPKQHYVGYKKLDNQPELLGFAAPYTGDAACRKRQATVNSWAHTKIKQPEILDNVLMSGFQLSKSVRRNHGWGKGNVTWRISDPRGFELEITSPNLAQVMECTTIVNGEIQGNCIWGREGGINVLLPEGSEPYQLATKLTALSTQKLNVKDFMPGDRVRLQDDSEAIYLGAYHILTYVTESKYRHSHGYDRVLKVPKPIKRHFWVDLKHIASKVDFFDQVLLDDGSKYPNPLINLASAIKVAEVLESNYVDVDVVKFASRLNQSRERYLSALMHGYITHVVGVSSVPFGKISFELGDSRPVEEADYGHTSFAIGANGEQIIIASHDRLAENNRRSLGTNDRRFSITTFKIDASFPVGDTWKLTQLTGSTWGGVDADTDVTPRRSWVFNTGQGRFVIDRMRGW